MKYLLGAALLSLSFPAMAQDAPAKIPTPNDFVALAQAGDWVTIPSSDLMVMDLAPDSTGKARRIVMQLMPAPFMESWVHNVRTLAKAHWWDATQVYRVQDNYVVQWGDVLDTKPLSPGTIETVQKDYVSPLKGSEWQSLASVMKRAGAKNNRVTDPYAPETGFYKGWPIAGDGKAFWPTHCYGMVGAGRDVPPNAGSGAELYAVIGQSPRHLDRNIALVGRVIEGMEYFASLPRGNPDDLGFYQYETEWVPITTFWPGDEVADLPRYEYLSTASTSFARYADARANRRDEFFIAPAGGADICNIPVPIRRKGD